MKSLRGVRLKHDVTHQQLQQGEVETGGSEGI